MSSATVQSVPVPVQEEKEAPQYKRAHGRYSIRVRNRFARSVLMPMNQLSQFVGVSFYDSDFDEDEENYHQELGPSGTNSKPTRTTERQQGVGNAISETALHADVPIYSNLPLEGKDRLNPGKMYDQQAISRECTQPQRMHHVPEPLYGNVQNNLNSPTEDIEAVYANL